jgi:hypothetical protein
MIAGETRSYLRVQTFSSVEKMKTHRKSVNLIPLKTSESLVLMKFNDSTDLSIEHLQS